MDEDRSCRPKHGGGGAQVWLGLTAEERRQSVAQQWKGDGAAFGSGRDDDDDGDEHGDDDDNAAARPPVKRGRKGKGH